MTFRNVRIGRMLRAKREMLERDKYEVAAKLAAKWKVQTQYAHKLMTAYEDGFFYGTTSEISVRLQGPAHLKRLADYMEELEFPPYHEVVELTAKSITPGHFQYPSNPGLKVRKIFEFEKLNP